MSIDSRLAPIKDDVILFEPTNEQGVVALFSRKAGDLGYRIKKIRRDFPDAILLSRRGKELRAEFEFKSSRFDHPAKDCDILICWEHDKRSLNKYFPVIELKALFKKKDAWVQASTNKLDWKVLRRIEPGRKARWTVPPRSSEGDIIVYYVTDPKNRGFENLFVIKKILGENLDWPGYLWAFVEKVCNFSNSIKLQDMRANAAIKASPPLRGNFQGRGNRITDYWSHYYSLIVRKNPTQKGILKSYKNLGS